MTRKGSRAVLVMLIVYSPSLAKARKTSEPVFPPAPKTTTGRSGLVPQSTAAFDTWGAAVAATKVAARMDINSCRLKVVDVVGFDFLLAKRQEFEWKQLRRGSEDEENDKASAKRLRERR